MRNIIGYQKEKSLSFSIVILLVLLATSAFPSFIGFKAVALPLLLPIIFYKLLKRRKVMDRKVMIVLGIIFVFAVLHLLKGDLTIIGALSFMLAMITIILAAIVIGDTFTEAFIKIMKFFSYIAVSVWVCLILLPSLHSTLLSIGEMLPQMMTDTWLKNTTNDGISFYLYYLPSKVTTSYVNFIRNCGPFFEPGLYATYLIVALVLNISKNHKLLHHDNWILIAAILTTCSSAGYVSLVLIILYTIFFSKKAFERIISILLVLLLWQPILQLDFMSEKITSNFESASKSSASRFGALIYHSEKIVKSPFIGYAGGTLPYTDFDMRMRHTDRILSPNGLSYPFVYWGIPFALCFYVFLFKGIKKLVLNNVKLWELWFIFIIILSAAFSQTVTTEPIFLLISAFSLVK